MSSLLLIVPVLAAVWAAWVNPEPAPTAVPQPSAVVEPAVASPVVPEPEMPPPPPPPPPPRPKPSTHVDASSPGAETGAHSCGLLVAAPAGQGMRAVRRLNDRNLSVDCLASSDEEPPAATVVWYSPGQRKVAEAVARTLPGGATLKPAEGLANAVEIRLGRAFLDAETPLLPIDEDDLST